MAPSHADATRRAHRSKFVPCPASKYADPSSRTPNCQGLYGLHWAITGYMKGLYPPSFKGLYCLFYLCLIRDTLGFPRYAQSSSALPGLTGIFLGYPSFHRFIRCALYCTIYFIYSILNFMQSLLAMQGLTTLPLISPSWKLHQIFDFTVSTRLIEFHWVVTWVLFSEDSLDLIRFYPFSFTVTRYDLVFTGQVSTCWLHFSLEIHWVLLSFYLMILNSLCFTKFSFQTADFWDENQFFQPSVGRFCHLGEPSQSCPNPSNQAYWGSGQTWTGLVCSTWTLG